MGYSVRLTEGFALVRSLLITNTSADLDSEHKDRIRPLKGINPSVGYEIVKTRLIEI